MGDITSYHLKKLIQRLCLYLCIPESKIPISFFVWRWRERYSGRIPSIDSEPLWMSKQSISNKRGTKYRSSPLAIPKRQPVITKHSTAYFLLKTQTRKAGSISFEMEKYQTGIKDASRHSKCKKPKLPVLHHYFKSPLYKNKHHPMEALPQHWCSGPPPASKLFLRTAMQAFQPLLPTYSMTIYHLQELNAWPN